MRSASLCGGCVAALRLRVAQSADADKGRRPSRALHAALLLAALLALPCARPLAAQALPPDERWRSLESAHFRVTFPAALDSLARVAAARAEQAYATLERSFVRPPRGRLEVVLTDHADVSNGSARVAPYPRIVIFARPPVDGFALSHFDDWLEMVITHELVHVFHLDLGGGLSTALRAVFGRVPSRWPFFPEAAAPGWVIEGLATWQESALTEAGRVRGTHHEMALRTAILEDGFEDMGQASGESAVWPGGSRAYIYGSLFFDYVANRYGERAVTTFLGAVAGQWIPYRLNAAARTAFGVSFGQAWRDWELSVTQEVGARLESLALHAPLTATTPVTRGARQAYYPQLSPDGETLLFARADGRSDTQLRSSAPDGSSDDPLARTNGLAAFSWMPDGGVLYAQYHFQGPYRIRSDLHVRSALGDDRQVTSGARLDHPSPTPDGRSALAVQFAPGTSSLVEVELASGEVRALANDDPSANWAFPRVSPNGRWIAASRWRPGAFFDVVILDRSGRVVAEVTRDRALDFAPAWSPDGRWLLWGSDRSGVPNVVAAPVDPESGLPGEVRQVTNLVTGAMFPSVDPSARWIYMSVYHVDGWDIERVAYDPASWTPPLPEDARFRAEDPVRAAPTLGALQVKDYSPLHTLRPRYWEPEGREPVRILGRSVLGGALGFSTEGDDVVGRHGYDLSALTTLEGQVDGALAYRYAGLGNPTLTAAVGQLWDADGPLLGEGVDGARDTLWVTERERSASAAATFRMPGFRVASSATLSGGMVWESRTLLDGSLEPTRAYQLATPTARLADVRASFSLSSARSYAFSVGTAEGVSALAQGRRRKHLALDDSLVGRSPNDRSFDELILRVNGYESFRGPGFANHVLALRVSAGAARGPAAGASHFRVGGTSGTRDPVTGLALFGASSFLFPVRGYPGGARRGRFAGSATAEYRFPLWLVNQGLGLFPLHVDRLTGALFADAGNAWGAVAAENPRRRAVASIGAELVSDILTFYSIPVTIRLGVAQPLVESDPARSSGLTPELYLRFGRPF